MKLNISYLNVRIIFKKKTKTVYIHQINLTQYIDHTTSKYIMGEMKINTMRETNLKLNKNALPGIDMFDYI